MDCDRHVTANTAQTSTETASSFKRIRSLPIPGTFTPGMWLCGQQPLSSLENTSHGMHYVFLLLPFTVLISPTPSSSTLAKGIFSLMGELIKFGVVMIVVMGGFVLSFYSILRDSLTYGQVRVSTASTGQAFCLLRKSACCPMRNAQRTDVPDGKGAPVPRRWDRRSEANTIGGVTSVCCSMGGVPFSGIKRAI